MRWISLYLMYFLCSPLLAQDSLEFIYVRHTGAAQGTAGPAPDPRKGDFYRNMVLSRISLSSRHNQHLLRVQLPQAGALPAGKDALPQALIAGLRTGALRAWHPSDMRTPYRFFHLVEDLTRLYGQPADDTTRWQDLGPEWFNLYVDFIYEKGFSAESSRDFLRPRFLRLVWCFPENPLGPVVLAVFPYHTTRTYLQSLQCEIEGLGMRTLDEVLTLHLFDAASIPITHDPARYPAIKARR